MTSRAMICGVNGQDGAYLAAFLLGKGYAVVGTSRDAANINTSNLDRLGLRGKVRLESMDITSAANVLDIITRVAPDEIYNLAGQSSVAKSFTQPVETIESVVTGTLNILECIRIAGRPIRFYNAGSSESFGDNASTPADENTPFSPKSPYAAAKAAAFWLVASYRQSFGIYCCSGLLFNHESILRPQDFVTQKIVAAAVRIVMGGKEKLVLGNMDIQRDWGWAPEYIEAMWLMLQQERAADYVIATGQTHSLTDFVAESFGQCGLEWRDHVEFSTAHRRPTDIAVVKANPSLAKNQLGWQAQIQLTEIIHKLIDGARAVHRR